MNQLYVSIFSIDFHAIHMFPNPAISNLENPTRGGRDEKEDEEGVLSFIMEGWYVLI